MEFICSLSLWERARVRVKTLIALTRFLIIFPYRKLKKSYLSHGGRYSTTLLYTKI